MRAYVGVAVILTMAGCWPSPVMQAKPFTSGRFDSGFETKVPPLVGGRRCGPFSPAALMACVERERVERDLRRIARPRPVSSLHHRAVRRLCAERFMAAGYELELHDYGSGVNVVGVKKGFSKGHEQIVVSAHYDYRAGCSGADDNASGVAALLEIARVLAEARFDRTLVVACWDEGERQQAGSAAYARRARQRGQRILAAVVLEAIAYARSAEGTQKVTPEFERLFPDQSLSMLDNNYRADFLAIIAERSTAELATILAGYARTLELTAHVLPLTNYQKFRMGELHRSDHLSFWEEKFPAMLLTDTGAYRNPYFQCKKADDLPHTLNFPFLVSTTRLTAAGLADKLEMR